MQISKYISILFPILLITLYSYFPTQFIVYSNSSLGKLLAVAAILMYTRIDFLYGVLCCLLVILYYQSDLVENRIAIESMKTIVLPKKIESFEPNAPKESIQPEVIKPIINESPIYNENVCKHGVDLNKYKCSECKHENEIVVLDNRMKDEDFLRMKRINARMA